MNDVRASEHVRDFAGWLTFDRLLTLLAFLAVSVSALLMPAQNDTWWHLKAGQDIWRAGRVLLHDTFSYTVNGQFWPNHEWLSQVVFYGVYALGGLPLLTIVCAAAAVGAWAIVWRIAPGSPRLKLLLTALALGSATTTWTLRPQALSLLLVAATIGLLTTRRYVWLPPLFLVWANLHGAVLTGILLLAAALAAAALENWRTVPRLLGVVLLCLVATLATPLGLRFWTEIPAFFARIRLVPVEEFMAPQLTLHSAPFWVAAAGLVALSIVRARDLISSDEARQRGHITMVACALALLATALTAARNVGPFLMAAVPALAVVAPRSWQIDARRTGSPRLNVAVALASSIAACIVVVYAYTRSIPHMAWRPVPGASIAAVNECRGNLYNRFDEGGYLIWFAPDRRVFVDSRFFPYPDDMLQEHVRVELTGDSADTFKRYDIHCAYLPAQSLVGNGLLKSGWKDLYRDDQWAVLTAP